jgi:hypothetical protein
MRKQASVTHCWLEYCTVKVCTPNTKTMNQWFQHQVAQNLRISSGMPRHTHKCILILCSNNNKGVLPLGPANSQDGVKFKEQDHSYKHLSCASPSLQLQNVNWLRNWDDRLKSTKAIRNYWRNPPH